MLNLAQKTSGRRRLSPPLPTLAILILAALLRIYRLEAQSLWSDEGNSVALARHTFAEIARRTAFDIHPPLYYWLLKIWVALFGDSEAALRSLSVVLGVWLVYSIWRLGKRLFTPRVGRLAALIAAVSPLQVYYAQETRMYMLLALLSTLTVGLAVSLFEHYRDPTINKIGLVFSALLYILTVSAGLYTHYAYPLILVVVNLVALYIFWPLRRPLALFFRWLGLQLIPLLIYLPWLPIAWRQITTWPSTPTSLSLWEIISTMAVTLLLGLSWPAEAQWMSAIGLGGIIVMGVWLMLKNDDGSRSSLHRPALMLILLWLLLPIIITSLIFSPAFLKFLLVSSPPLALLVALIIDRLITPLQKQQPDYSLPLPAWLRYSLVSLLLALLLLPSLLSLYHYYHNPRYARDNYRGIVSFIKAVGDPQDAIILNAEGQQDVFNYYYDRPPSLSAKVYPLPERRPLDETATLATLQQVATEAEEIYAVYWATEQADPTGMIEGWLDANLFKATDQWYGNVRLVSYATPPTIDNLTMISTDARLGPHIRLTGFALAEERVRPGDILQLVLRWQTEAPLAENYTLFIQLLDSANHLVGQRDTPPRHPTTTWPVNVPITETHGLFIEPGTPPGPHRLIVGLYDSATGQRLPLAGGGDFVALGMVEIIPPTNPLPVEAFAIQNWLEVSMSGVTLLGYDLYKLGHRSTPETPLQTGDPLQIVAYWQAEPSIAAVNHQLRLEVESAQNQAVVLTATRPLAGVEYPPSAWSVGEIVRAQYSFNLEGVTPGRYRVVFRLSGEREEAVARSGFFRVE